MHYLNTWYGRLLGAGLAIVISVTLAGEPDTLEDDAKQLSELLEKIPKVASEGKGMIREEQDLATEIAKHGGSAADSLVAMLDSKDPEIYQLVTYCLVYLKQGDLKPKHLDPMIRAARQKQDWLPNAIANIRTDEAAIFLAKEFRRAPKRKAQIDSAVGRMAPLSIDPLIAEFGNASEDESDFLSYLTFVFRDCGDKAAGAVQPLTDIAIDSSQPLFRRQAAIRYLGAIGPSSKKSIPALKGLRVKEPEQFDITVMQAIAEIQNKNVKGKE